MSDRTDALAAPAQPLGRPRAWTVLAVVASVAVLGLMLAQAPGGVAADVLRLPLGWLCLLWLRRCQAI